MGFNSGLKGLKPLDILKLQQAVVNSVYCVTPYTVCSPCIVFSLPWFLSSFAVSQFSLCTSFGQTFCTVSDQVSICSPAVYETASCLTQISLAASALFLSSNGCLLWPWWLIHKLAPMPRPSTLISAIELYKRISPEVPHVVRGIPGVVEMCSSNNRWSLTNMINVFGIVMDRCLCYF
jgi:hypothetical protein